MDREDRIVYLVAFIVLLFGALLLVWSYMDARAEQQYRVLDTTRDQFLGIEQGALGSTSALTFTAVTSLDDGEVGLLPLGVVGDWEVLGSPLLPRPIEAPVAVAYIETDPPFRQRIYLIGGRDPTPPAERLRTIFTCEVYEDGSLSDWSLQAALLPRGLASSAASISTQDYSGNPITPTVYVVGGRFTGGTSPYIYYAHIDPLTLDLSAWQTATVGLPQPRVGLSAVAHRGYLYTLGGFDGVSTYSGAVYHFAIDETGNPFARLVDVNFPDSPTNNPNAAYHQTVLLQGASPSFLTDTLYVIGGYNSSNSTPRVLRGDIYSPGGPQEGYIQSWQDIAADDLPEPLSAFAVAVGNVQGAGRQIYVVGGTQGRDGTVPQDTIRSAVVNDEDNSLYAWYGGSWLTSPVLPNVRYRHAAVQLGEYVYVIAGQGETQAYRDVLRGSLLGSGAWHYAPQGEFRSRVVDMGSKYRLTGLQWTSTITPTDPGVTMTLQFRAGNRPNLSDAVGAWTDLLPSSRGYLTQTLYPVPQLPNFAYHPPVARYVQYRAVLHTTPAYSNVTPLLHEVGLFVEDSPDLVISGIQISCDGCYGSMGIISRTIHVQATVYNQGGNIPYGNNFYVAMFITNSNDYMPLPPDLPMDPQFLPGSRIWGVQGSDLPSGSGRTLTTTLFFTQAQSIFLYVYADYNDESEPPDYDVGESDWGNNLTVFNVILVDPYSASQTETAWYWGTQTAMVTPSPSATVSPTPRNKVYLPLILRQVAVTPSPP